MRFACSAPRRCAVTTASIDPGPPNVRTSCWPTSPAGATGARHTLAALLWPELDAAPARRNLRKLVFRAARLPGVSGMESRSEALRWRVESDLSRLDETFARGDWAAAIALYRGPLLDGLEFDSGEAFADWLRFERARVATRYGEAAAKRSPSWPATR
jgi:hypothetical protein